MKTVLYMGEMLIGELFGIGVTYLLVSKETFGWEVL